MTQTTLYTQVAPNQKFEVVGVDNPLHVDLSGTDNSLFGELKTVSRTPLIELNSAYGKSVVRDVVTETNSGTVTNGTGEIDISTGATANSVAGIKSAEAGRYVPGYAAEIGIGMRFPTAPTGEQEAKWGGRSIGGTDGFIWGYDTGGLYIALLSSGVENNKTYQSNWNLDKVDGTGKSGVTLDPTAGNIFQIDFTWYGYGQIIWAIVLVRNGVQEIVPVHGIKVNGSASIADPNLQVFGEVLNGATTSDYTAYVGGRQYSIIGEYRPDFRFSGQYRAAVNTSTTSVPTVTFRSKTAFQNRSIKMDEVSVIPTTEPVIVEMVLNGSLTGASYVTPTNHTAAETACEVDISATAITGGTVIWSDYFAAGTSPSKGALGDAIVNLGIPAGQPISLCVRTPSGTGTCAAFFRMREEW